MKDAHPYRLPREIPFEIPADWTQDQARAVAELLTELSMLVMSYYQLYDYDDACDEPCPPDEVAPPGVPAAATPPFDDDLPF
jgi:hypothetical protein